MKKYIVQNREILLLSLQSFAGLLLMPILISYAGLEVYAELFLCLATASLLEIILNTGYTSFITSFAEKWLKTNKYDTNVTIILTIVFAQFLVGSLLLNFIATYSNVQGILGFPFRVYILLLSLSTVFRELVSVVFRMDNNYLRFVRIATLFVFIDFFLKILYTLFTIEFSVTAYILMSSSLKIILFSALFIRYYGSVQIQRDDMSLLSFDNLRFCANWTGSSIVGKITAFVDKPLVNSIGDLELLGYYAVAQRTVSVLAQFRAMLKNIWIYEALRTYPRHTAYSISKLLKPFSLIFLLSLVALPIYTVSFLGLSVKIVLALYLGMSIVEFLWLYYYHISLRPLKVKNSRYIAIIQTLSSLLYLSVLYVLIDFGVSGVITAMYVRMISLVIIQNYYDRKI